MESLNVDYVLLQEKGKLAQHTCVKIKSNLKDIAEKIADLDIFWDGDSNATFITAINSDIAYAMTLLVKIQDNLKLLSSAIEEYQNTEIIVHNIIGGLKI